MKYFKKNKVFIESDITCSICLDPITSNGHTTKCGHCFHKTCIKTALHTSRNCPYCRTKITRNKRWFSTMIDRAKNWLGHTMEYYTNHHLILSITVGVPFMYLGVLLGILLIAGEYMIRAKNCIVPDLSVD